MKEFSHRLALWSAVGLSLCLASTSVAQPNRADPQDRDHPRHTQPSQNNPRVTPDNRDRDRANPPQNRDRMTQQEIDQQRRAQQQRMEDRYRENERRNNPSYDRNNAYDRNNVYDRNNSYNRNSPTYRHDPRTVEHPRFQQQYRPQPLPRNFNSLRNEIRKNNHYYSRGPAMPRHVKIVKGKRFPPGYGRPLPYEQARYLPYYQGYEWRSVGRDLVLVAVGTGIIYAILDNVLN